MLPRSMNVRKSQQLSTCDCDRVVVSTAHRYDSVGDVHQLRSEVVDVCIGITSELAVVHFTTCKQLTLLCQTTTHSVEQV